MGKLQPMLRGWGRNAVCGQTTRFISLRKKAKCSLKCISYCSRRCLEKKQGVVVFIWTKTKYRGYGGGEEAKIYEDPTTFKTKDSKYVSLNGSSPWQRSLLIPHSFPQHSALWIRQHTKHTSINRTYLLSLFSFSKLLTEAYLGGFFKWNFFKLLFIQPTVFFTQYYSLFSMCSISTFTNQRVQYFSNFNMCAHRLRTLLKWRFWCEEVGREG